jgi:hypothetical protein
MRKGGRGGPAGERCIQRVLEGSPNPLSEPHLQPGKKLSRGPDQILCLPMICSNASPVVRIS